MTETFWTSQTQVPAVPVMEVNTVGDQQDNPIQNVPGAQGGALPTGWAASAQAVYPRYGSAAFPSVPISSLNLADFPTWHSEHQRQHILAQGGSYRIPATGPVVAFYMLTAGNTKPLNLMNLTLTDYAMLSSADQAAIRPNLLSLGIATRLGLSTDKTGTQTAISGLIASINAVTAMPAADRDVFIEQLNILSRQVTAANMIIPDKIGLEIKAISDRFDRAKTFVQTVPSVAFTGIEFIRNENSGGLDNRSYGIMTGIEARGRSISSDQGATVTNGLAEFMRAERAILAMQKRREGLSASDGIRDPKIDLANLIYQLQLLYEGEAEGVADGGTEEIRQLHKLLQDYGVMQRLVQETIKYYDSSKPEEKRRFMNLGGRADGGVVSEHRAHNDGNHDMSIRFLFPGQTIVSPGGGTNGSDTGNWTTYQETAGYHWFHLQATTPGGTMGRHPSADSDADPPYNGVSIANRYSRSYNNGDSNSYGKQNGGLSAAEMQVFSMFSDDSWASALRQGHPMETLYGIDRPVQKFTGESEDENGGLAFVRKTVWDSFSTQLNDTVTLLNQRNQLKQNEIESATRRQNRHFDLGNNALKKMNDLLMTIGRM